MKRFIGFSLTGLIILFLGSCNCIQGEGPMVKQDRDVGSFSSIVLQSSADIVLIASSENIVVVEAQENLMELITVENENGTLVIGGHECFNNSQPVRISIGVNELESLTLQGSGSIIGEGLFNAGWLDIKLSGSGTITMDLSTEGLNAEINGSGDIHLKGFTDLLELNIFGSGDIDAFDLVSDEVIAKISGSGNANVNASKRMEATINGSGDIHYTGTATDIQTEVNGSGSVIQVD